MSVFKQQAEFMTACGQTVNKRNDEQSILYSSLIDEEIHEFWHSETSEN